MSFSPPPPPPPASSSSGQRKTNHVTANDEPFPSPSSLSSATVSHTQSNFRISYRKLPILKAAPIEAMSTRLGIPIPEMIFGDNLASITHLPTGWSISFTAEPALDQVDKTGSNMLRVAYAKEWSSSREKTSAGISEVVKPYDWSYTTAYKGDETIAILPTSTNIPQEQIPTLQPSTSGAQIPLPLLQRRDPILFAQEVVLYESELDDNGISILSVKFRVMPKRMLLLSRLFMRLDNVLVRVRDTRVYVDFETDQVIREYTAREEDFEKVRQGLVMQGMPPAEVTVALRDANQVVGLLKVVEQTVEEVSLKNYFSGRNSDGR
ncbi:TIP41-like protein [Rhypophila decipiens]|uniref:TIP41-like protein n=1 Tax=Rhypophila decipiens TaxID=261697 RepID=A0AAN6YEY6_9PEZI|nr:TIP41-like protein [Rhypophila decipiens]